MIRDLLISGQVADRYEFYVTIMGPRVSVGLLYEGDETHDRFFAGPTEVRLTADGVSHKGNGGGFCSYMFGVDVPDSDTLRREVRNRLFMHGAGYDSLERRLSFSNDTAGFETWERVFNDGHAFTNYFFFIRDDKTREVRVTQERLLRAVGKHLKRAELGRRVRDGRELAHQLFEALDDPSSTLFLVKLVDTHAEEFARTFRGLYTGKGSLTAEDRKSLDSVSQRLAIEPYQRERIQLDVLYNDDENKKVIDQYKDALAAHFSNSMPEEALLPRLTLLRAVLARNSVPARMFDRLDSLLVDAGKSPAEPEFMREARAVLHEVFAEGHGLRPGDMIGLLTAKRAALEQRRIDFESVLLEASEGAENLESNGRGQQSRNWFEQIVSYLDLASTAWTLVSSLAYINDFDLTEERLESLLEARQAFDELRPGLFAELFLTPLVQSRYVGMYGRRRIESLAHGLSGGGGVDELKGVIESVRVINSTAKTHAMIDGMIRAAVTDMHLQPLGSDERAELKRDVENRLAGEHGVEGKVSDALFDLVLLSIEEEYHYARRLLPEIIATRDFSIREDFLATSSLDLFRIEELESAYVDNRLKDVLVRSAGK